MPSLTFNGRSFAPLSTALVLPLCLAISSPVLAQQTTASQNQQESRAVQEYDIPAGPLSRVLSRFAAESGLLLSSDARLTEGKQSEGLEGEFATEEALRKLLAGTGLTYRLEEDRQISLMTQEQQQTFRLDPLQVVGWRQSENSGYRSPVLSSATKTEAPIVDTPLSVSVVTEDVIRDQNARNVEDALRNVAGVSAGPNASNASVQEEFTIRGFRSALVRINGVQRRSSGPLSVANIASVEVLKGPASVLYGDLSPGGFVNIQTKRPQREEAYELSIGGSQVTEGRGTSGEFGIDATGALSEDGNLLYRFVGSAEGGSRFIEDAHYERYLLAPSFSYLALNDRLRLDLDLSYLRNDETFLFGVPSGGEKPDLRIDRSTFLGSSDNNKLTEDYTAELRASYQLSPSTDVDAALTYHRNEHVSRALRPFGPGTQEVDENNEVGRSFSLNDFETTDMQVESNLTHRFSVGSTAWEVLVGGDARREELNNGDGGGTIFNFDTVNVLDPQDTGLPGRDDPNFNPRTPFEQTIDVFGVYTQADVWLTDRFKLLGGLRYTRVNYEFRNTSPFLYEENTDNVDPRLGALFKLTPATSLYGSYSTSFEPEFSFDPDDVAKPVEAEQFELGVKQELMDGRFIATLSAYEITQKNLFTTDINTGESRQIGEAETRGIEAEVRGQLTDELSLLVSYANLDNAITRNNDGEQGNRLRNVPEEEASAYLNYQAFNQGGNRLTVGGGVFYEGERFTSSSNEVTLPSYTTVDLNARYTMNLADQSLSVQGGLRNVFDKEYFVSGFGEGISFRGQPRTVYLKLTSQF